MQGILFGLMPHSFCIAFVLFSVIGATTATSVLKRFLLIPDLFSFLVLVSLFLATISSLFYLKKTGHLSAAGIKNNWRYISLMYFVTVSVNLLFFFVIFPVLANSNANYSPISGLEQTAKLSLKVDIPCSGHALLITDEISKKCNVLSVNFKMPNTFEITYDPKDTSPDKITGLDIFKTYKATVN